MVVKILILILKPYDFAIMLAFNNYEYMQNLILVESCIIYFSLKWFYDYDHGGGTTQGNFSCFFFFWDLWVDL